MNNTSIMEERSQKTSRPIHVAADEKSGRSSILLIENKEIFLTLAQSAIELLPENYHIITASCGEAALEILQKTDINLVISANHLPDMDGFRLVKLAKTIKTDIPVIIWTSDADPQQISMLKELGCPRVHSQKPHDIFDLEDSITTLLAGRTSTALRTPEATLMGQPSQESQELLKQGMTLVNGHHFREAKRALTDYIKIAPHTPSAWLWLSRCINKLADTEEYLHAAMELFPDNKEIAAEAKMISDFKASTGAEQVRRCPFCWSPINPKKAQCSHCQAFMLFHKKINLQTSSINKELINQAITTMKQVDDFAQNPNLLYYLGLGYFNTGNHGAAEEQLRKALEIAQDKTFFEAQLAELKQNQQASAAPQKPLNSNTKTVFVVEDSPTTRRVIVKTLQQAGYKTLEAKDGLEALSMLNTFTPDLILLDIILPKMDGYKVLSVIKNTGTELARTPVVMLTSKDGMLDKLKGKMAGTNAYLTKPFRSIELTSTIEKQLAPSDQLSFTESAYQN